MRKLRAVRLINWYHFVDHTFDMDGSCLIFGDNGSGKSTILDAIQWALVADQAQVRFNKAANENSRRTLYGYVRYKLGSEDEERPGQLRFGRKNATSHVVLSFADDEEPDHSFCCGVAMEATESDTRVDRLHWVAPGADIDWLPALEEGEFVRPLRELRKALREQTHAQVFGDARTYRDEVRHRLGPLPDSFHRLLIKSLDFKPIGKVRDFVFHYLLDDQPVDTAALQSNIEHYKRWESEAVAAERRIEALRQIVDHGRRVDAERLVQRSHQYVSLAARREMHRVKAAELDDEVHATKRRSLEVGAEIEACERELKFLRDQRDQVIGALQASPTAQTVAELERALSRAKDDLARAGDSERAAREILKKQTGLLERILAQPARDVRAQTGLFPEGSLVGAPEVPDVVERLFETLSAEGVLVGRDIRTWEGRLQKLLSDLTMAKGRLEEKLEQAKSEGQELEKERTELMSGRHRYPDGAEALLHLLRAKLRGRREPRPLAELIEVPNERWRDAVEGYLNTRRFDVIVDPEDFQRALSLYEKNKRDYHLPGRGKVFIAQVGLVDVERVMEKSRGAENRSLASQVETDDPYARAYVDYVMGDVICVDHERELRNHRRAITDTVMTYQNYAARQTPRRVYERHYVGRAAIARRIEEIERRLGEIHEQVTRAADHHAWLRDSERAAQNALGETRRLPDLVEEAKQIPNLEGEVEVLSRRLESIDQSELATLKAERSRLDASIRGVEEKHRLRLTESARADEKLRHLERRLGEARSVADAVQAEIEESFPETEEQRGFEERYEKIRAEQEPAQIEETYSRQHNMQRTRVENLVQRLVKLKTEYANSHAMVADTEGPGYAEFEQEHELWSDSRLPEYRERIAETKKQAIQQLAEDVIFRLREHLQSVRRQIDELNRALKDVPFGSERYSFALDVAPEHRAFYDLIMEAGAFERDSLFGGASMSSSDTQRTLEELFERLTSGRAQEVKSELAERADYREYFKYDLRIHHADGTVSMYDRVSADKSGGETQTPYYVAILASMYRVYRATSLHGQPLAGLVLLDEAFGKMDENRIRATLALSRGLSLQLVMATPKERSELVAPHVETSLYIHKDPVSGAPTVLDFTKEFERDAEQARDGEDRAADEAPRGLRA